jgi:phage baseplate assembly protein W
MSTFKGFSTVDRVRAPFTLTDAELIKRDLLNELFTRKGERVMRPNFGSIVWDLLMDPSTNDLDRKIKQDIERIIGKDPRVELIKTQVAVLDHTILAEVDIKFLPFNDVDKLYLEYVRDITQGVDG